MFIVKQNGKEFELPLTDRQMWEIEEHESINMFIPAEEAYCVKMEFLECELREKLPRKVKLQEINFLSYILEQCNRVQGEQLKKNISAIPFCRPGEMINHALRICPEAAGMSRNIGIPYYTGDNLFDLMEYKRLRDRRKDYPDFQMVKVYFPVEVSLEPVHGEESLELDAETAASYCVPIARMLEEHVRPRDSFEEWVGHFCKGAGAAYQEYGILFERPGMEVRNGQLWGVVVMEMSHTLTVEEIGVVQAYVDGGITDSWGEDLPDIETPEGRLRLKIGRCTEVYQQAKAEMMIDEKELFSLQSPFYEEHVLNLTGFVADFRGKNEYAECHPVWLEMCYDRKRIRIPLPADATEVHNARKRIGAPEKKYVNTWLKAPEIVGIGDFRFLTIDLEKLNRFAEAVNKMTPEAYDVLWEEVFGKNLGQDELISNVIQTLECFQRRKLEPEQIKQIGSFHGLNL